MNRAVCFTSSLILLGMSQSAPADVSMLETLTVEARGLISVFEMENTIATEISGNLARIDDYSGVPAKTLSEAHIYQIPADRNLTLYPSQKQYLVRSLGQKRADDLADIDLIEQVPSSGPDALPISNEKCEWTAPQVSVKRTGKKQTIASIKSEQHMITAAATCRAADTTQSCDMTWIMEYWNARRMPGIKELTYFREALADGMGTTEILAMTPLIPQGLIGVFNSGWDEVLYEAEGIKGYPVKSVLSLHIGGKRCRTRSNEEITRDTVWTNVKRDSITATKNSAAATVGNVVAGQVMQQVGTSVGGIIAGTVLGSLTKDAVFDAMNRPKPVEPPTVKQNAADVKVEGQIQIFKITTELKSINERPVARDRFEAPAHFEEIVAEQP